MLLRETESGDLVDVVDIVALTNPFVEQVVVQYQCGEDLQEPEVLPKRRLGFPSGERLPVGGMGTIGTTMYSPAFWTNVFSIADAGTPLSLGDDATIGREITMNNAALMVCSHTHCFLCGSLIA